MSLGRPPKPPDRARSSASVQSAAPRGPSGPGGLLFVEGPGDRAILEGWARSVSPRFERSVRAATVILGGRQPARAREELRKAREHAPGIRGLCILDRDALPEEAPDATAGLEIFTWSRRHIESYLLVPEAIRRALRRRDHDRWLVRLLADSFPRPGDEAAHAALHAKQLLGPRGPIAAEIGRAVPTGRVARAMRPEEFHPDVHALLARLQDILGMTPTAPVVTLRRPRS